MVEPFKLSFAIKNRNDNDDGVEGFDAVFHFLQYDSSEFTHI